MSTNAPRNVLLVGGTSGIGEALTVRLASRGDQLIVASRRAAESEPTAGVSYQTFDATDPAAQLTLPDSLDAAVYLPGTITLKPFHRLSEENFLNDLQVNFFGAVRVLQQALPALKRAPSGSGSVVLFSTVACAVGMPFHASIASAKAAVEGLGRSLAAEWAPAIRVNVIAPSLTDTPLAGNLLSSEAKREAAAKRHPLDRVGEAGEVAELVEFLIGSGGAFTTGQVFALDGGISSIRTL